MPKRRTDAPAGSVAGQSRGSPSCDWRRARHEVAAATLTRATDEATGIFARARLLEPLIEVMLATGSTSAARLAADEMVQIAGDIGAPLVTAMAERAQRRRPAGRRRSPRRPGLVATVLDGVAGARRALRGGTDPGP